VQFALWSAQGRIEDRSGAGFEHRVAVRSLLEAHARERVAVQLATDGAVDAARSQFDLAARRYVSLEATGDLARAAATSVTMASAAAFGVIRGGGSRAGRR